MTPPGDAVRSRLTDLARKRGVNGEFMLTRWVMERFLARVAASGMGRSFALKGALLFTVWDGDLLRPTYDVDLHGVHLASSGRVAEILRRILDARMPEEDGLVFQLDQAKALPLVGSAIPGERVTVPVSVGAANLKLKVDVAFGNPVTPGFECRWYPSLLPTHKPIRLLCYPRETVIAEKLAAATEFGCDNTRMRDYYDIWLLSRRYWFNGPTMVEAITRTFASRDAGRFLDRDDGYWEAAFEPSFPTSGRERIWRHWLALHAPSIPPPEFRDVVERTGAFAMPLLRSARSGKRPPGRWTPRAAAWLN